jgi:hypothetical protein
MSETATIDASADEGPTPEQALAEARQRLATSESQRQAAEQARQAAEQRAQQAGGAVQSAHEGALETRLNAEKTRLASAERSYRAAREAGDIDAEILASKELAGATHLIAACENEKARLASQRANAAQQQQQVPQQSSRIPGPAARAWMDDHPKINSDPTYGHAAEQAHNRAIARGHEPESSGYFDSINADLERSFGANHGRDAGMADPPPARQAPSKPPASSYSTPRSNGGATTRNGEAADVAKVCDAISSMGDTRITPEILQEHADASKMSLKDYVASQMQILAERKQGRSGGMGQDIVYR